MSSDYTHLYAVMPNATAWDEACYDWLKNFLMREPLDNEILNMRTDSSLQMSVLLGN